MRNPSVILLLLLYMLLAAGALIFWQPWQHKRLVLSTPVPGHPETVEFWEQAYWLYGAGYEYQTWLVLRSPAEAAHCHLIDEEAIEFRDVTLLVSSDRERLRIETTSGDTTPRMIAEYNFRDQSFRAENEPTVSATKGWSVVARKHVCCVRRP